MQQQRDVIRKQVRQKRRALPTELQQTDANRILNRLITQPRIKQAQKISVTLAHDGEIDTHLFIEWCWAQQKQIYLPIVDPAKKGGLLFLEYTQDTQMVTNRYGISEPKLESEHTCSVADLDIIITPLVAFDTAGNRIGMGGGYYDRILAPWFKDRSGPYPIGLAHDCQLVNKLPIEPWDVPLPEIITPSKRYQFITKN
ncbi:MAG: 5-formyltetrahydrofolate cyclo-ligase [Psychromonas sp.]|nr:5-formyltetrahydrofolate cyclo-ligase [Alteromonadales bacterium]MCP5078450.1 5-formyltetrahydrofolate cyclo-ligase [Psychromonas sp.]